VTLAAVGPTGAFQCPTLIHQIYTTAGTRFDQRAYDAREKAAEAARLHADRRHDDAQKIATEGLELLDVRRRPHSTR
jgi:hypothetical protein